LVETVRGLDIVEAVERVGLRYINYFGFDIFSQAKLLVSLGGQPLKSDETLVRAIMPGKRFKSLLHVSNRATIMIEGAPKTGSVIDVDTSLESELDDFFDKAVDIVEEGHTEEKEVFFSLLTDEYIATLNPEYPEK